MKPLRILAIESSCDETAAAVVEGEGNRLSVLSDVVSSQVAIHRLYGGVVPEIASRAHSEAISSVTYEAMERANLSLGEIDCVAVTSHPGLIGALLVGVNFAKGLAASHSLPLVAVDHIKGHIAASYLLKEPPKPPFLSLVVSGGHTSIIRVTDYNEMQSVGHTRDDAMGEAYDKVGRLLSLPYPAGAAFDRLASEGFLLAAERSTEELTEERVGEAYAAFRQSEAFRALPFPSPLMHGEAPEFSFSGPKTAAVNLLHRYSQSGITPDRALFAASYTYHMTEGVAEGLAKALSRYPEDDLVLAGGVAANSHLRRRLARLAEAHGRRFFCPPLSLCGDNGAMIGAAGYYEFLAGRRAGSDLNASALHTW